MQKVKHGNFFYWIGLTRIDLNMNLPSLKKFFFGRTFSFLKSDLFTLNEPELTLARK
jgi:hypothetical protein